MTHYMGIITAYGAVAVMAWFAALLQPGLLPAARESAGWRNWKPSDLAAIALVPLTRLPISLLAGAVLSVLGLMTYFSTRGELGAAPAALGALFTVPNAMIAARVLVFDLAMAAGLSLLAKNWSPSVAIAVAALGIAGWHAFMLLPDGLQPADLAMLIANTAAASGLFAAVLFTRNIVWFWPVHILLYILHLQSG